MQSLPCLQFYSSPFTFCRYSSSSSLNTPVVLRRCYLSDLPFRENFSPGRCLPKVLLPFLLCVVLSCWSCGSISTIVSLFPAVRRRKKDLFPFCGTVPFSFTSWWFSYPSYTSASSHGRNTLIPFQSFFLFFFPLRVSNPHKLTFWSPGTR